MADDTSGEGLFDDQSTAPLLAELKEIRKSLEGIVTRQSEQEVVHETITAQLEAVVSMNEYALKRMEAAETEEAMALEETRVLELLKRAHDEVGAMEGDEARVMTLLDTLGAIEDRVKLMCDGLSAEFEDSVEVQEERYGEMAEKAENVKINALFGAVILIIASFISAAIIGAIIIAAGWASRGVTEERLQLLFEAFK